MKTLNDEPPTPSTPADPTASPGAEPDDRPGNGAGRPRRLRRHRRLLQVVPVALALVVVPTPMRGT